MCIAILCLMCLHTSISKKKLYVFFKNTQNYSHDTGLGGGQFSGQQLNNVLVLQYFFLSSLTYADPLF